MDVRICRVAKSHFWKHRRMGQCLAGWHESHRVVQQRPGMGASECGDDGRAHRGRGLDRRLRGGFAMVGGWAEIGARGPCFSVGRGAMLKRTMPDGTVTGFWVGCAGGLRAWAGEPGADAVTPAEGFRGGFGRGSGAGLAERRRWGRVQAGGDGGGETVGDVAQAVADEFVGRGRQPVRKGAAANLRLDQHDQVLDQVQELLGCRFGHPRYLLLATINVKKKSFPMTKFFVATDSGCRRLGFL